MIIPDIDAHEGRYTTLTAAPTSSLSARLLSRAVHEISTEAAVGSARLSRAVARLVYARKDEETEEECHPEPNVNLCEKPAAASNIDIVVPVCIAGGLLIVLFITLFYFHVQRQKRDEAEWSSKNNHEMEDYGIEVPPRPKDAYQRG